MYYEEFIECVNLYDKDSYAIPLEVVLTYSWIQDVINE